MYISKALQNIRQRPNGLYPNLSSDGFWTPNSIPTDGTFASQASAGPERACGVVFSSGGVLTDNDWMVFQASFMSLTSMRSWIASNRSDINMNASYASLGNGRILFQDGQRVLDSVDNALGYFTYGTQFNRMYIAMASVSGTLSTTTSITTWLELTPADLKAMGADITIDGSGNGTLNSPLSLNNIILK